jgi:hypothetical protein
MYRPHCGGVLSLAIALLLLALPAAGQDKTPPSPPQPPSAAPAPAPAPAPAAAPSPENKEEARKHYKKGLELFDAEAYEAALVELERAYQLAPSYQILYNTGKIYRVRNDLVAAIHAFQRYLGEGGNDGPADRRLEVQQYIAELLLLVARVQVTSHLQGVEVSVDDFPQGKLPMERPLLLNPGRRKVTASKAGYSPATQVVSVVAGDFLRIDLEPQNLTVNVRREETLPTLIPIGWAGTAILTGSAIVFGVLSANQSAKLSDTRNDPTATRPTLDDERSKMRTYAIVADLSTAGAVLAGGASLYFTLKWVNRDKKEQIPRPGGVNVGFAPTGVSLSGLF